MATIINRYSKGSDNNISIVDIDGTEVTVTVTATPSVVRRWLQTVLYFRRYHTSQNRLIIGLGVQWTPGCSDPPADTLQLCIGSRCLIFQLSHARRVPLILRKLLENPNHTFVGFWNHSDRRKLENSEHNLELCRNLLDLRLHVKTNNGESLAQASVDEIVEECLGFEVNQSNEISKSDWDNKHLINDQIVYACVDAYCAFQIGKDIQAWDIDR